MKKKMPHSISKCMYTTNKNMPEPNNKKMRKIMENIQPSFLYRRCAYKNININIYPK